MSMMWYCSGTRLPRCCRGEGGRWRKARKVFAMGGGWRMDAVDLKRTH